jgi:hypothetical protein
MPRKIRITAGALTVEASLNGSPNATLIWNALPIEAEGGRPTPSSRSPNEIRPHSPVNVIGKVAGDAAVFKRVHPGTKVRLERA